jgi:3-hydroxyphenylacetate 6-hydroxylase
MERGKYNLHFKDSDSGCQIQSHWLTNLNMHRIADSKDLTGNPLLTEIIEVEAGISRYRETSRNLSNYIPLLRYVNPVLSAIGVGASNQEGARMGARRVAYHDVLLSQLKNRIESGTDLPCIQGAVLKDPGAKLNETELLSVSLSMMAVSSSF